jgi:demethoxyubiquinone hydroxylase (CLK1/Coq7/Cat5 family)
MEESSSFMIYAVCPYESFKRPCSLIWPFFEISSFHVGAATSQTQSIPSCEEVRGE